MQQLSSVNNPLVKQLSKLVEKKGREATGLYLIEGFHLFEEALKSHRKPVYILGTEPALQQAETDYQLDLAADNIILINKAIAHHLAATKTSQEIFMVLKMGQPKQLNFNYGKWVLLDQLADPGNVGTIIRTADAAGFNGVILAQGSVDLYNPKVQRAMQGSQFHLELLSADLMDVVTQFKQADIPVYASVLDESAQSLANFEPVAELALVIGNEAHGIRPEVATAATAKLYIPIHGQAESLNAAVAAGIMIYHFA